MRIKAIENAAAWVNARLLRSVPAIVSRARRWHAPSLLSRLILLLLVGAAVVYLVAVFSIWLSSNKLVNANLERLAVQWVTELDKLGAPLYASDNARPPSVIADRIKNFPEVAYVRYFARDGVRVLHTYGNPTRAASSRLRDEDMRVLANQASQDTPYLLERLSGGHLRVRIPVRVKAIRSDGLLTFNLQTRNEETVRVIGFIELGVDASFYKRELERAILQGSLVTAFVFLLALIIGRRLLRNALRPLLELQAPLARLARGDTDVVVAPSGDAEIVAIGKALNVTISALRQRDEALRRLAERDSLTGLYNRRYFTMLLQEELVRCNREQTAGALLFIDLDRFKVINDTLGHAAGDRLLVNLADLIKGRMRESDIVCRFAGDEFTVIARNVPLDRAQGIAKSIVDIVSSYVLIEDGQSFSISCSVGIAIIAPDAGGAEEVLARADSACLKAKSAGRNCCAVFEEDGGGVEEVKNWPATIRAALAADRFTVLYQPIVPLCAADEMPAAEVLVRLIDDNGRIWLPNAFMSSAERAGLMKDIDKWVIGHVAATLAGLPPERRAMRMFINLGTHSFQDGKIVQFIKTTVNDHGLDPHNFVFEVAEQTMVRYIDKARRFMQSLIEAGFRFALNDFGMGVTNFAYLKHLPVDYVKIDGALIEGIGDEPVDKVVVEAIAKAAHTLHKQVVAQWVKDEEALRCLRHYGVDYAQGNGLAAPGPLSVLGERLDTQAPRAARYTA